MTELGSYERKPIAIIYEEKSAYKDTYAGAEDIDIDGDLFEIIVDPSSLMQVRDNLDKSGFEIEKAEFDYIAKDPVKIDNQEDAKRVLRLIEALEDDDDVANVYSNFDIPEEMMEEIG